MAPTLLVRRWSAPNPRTGSQITQREGRCSDNSRVLDLWPMWQTGHAPRVGQGAGGGFDPDVPMTALRELDRNVRTTAQVRGFPRLSLPHLAEQDTALHLVLLLRLDQRNDDRLRRHAEVLGHRVGDVLHQRALLVRAAAAQGVNDDFRHNVLPFDFSGGGL